MRSMTGFGQAQRENDRYRIGASIRGLNHRFLDISVRLREEYRQSEALIRELVGGSLQRGRVEVTVDIQDLGERRVEIAVERGVVQEVHSAFQGLAGQGLIRGELTPGDLLRLPEVLRIRFLPREWGAADEELLRRVVSSALEQVTAARSAEGRKLSRVLEQRLDELSRIVERLESRRQQMEEALHQNLRRRLDELLEGRSIPEDRLAQEAAILVERSDVSEELDRLVSHIEHFRQTMGEGGPVGKRLDFLSQEIFRELNTLAAKCREGEMLRWTLDGKLVCEQLREQIQNVE